MIGIVGPTDTAGFIGHPVVQEFELKKEGSGESESPARASAQTIQRGRSKGPNLPQVNHLFPLLPFSKDPLISAFFSRVPAWVPALPL